MSLRGLFLFLPLFVFLLVTHGFAQEEATVSEDSATDVPASEVGVVEVSPNNPDEVKSPHAEYFATFDTDDDGQISREEAILLPEQLKRIAGRGGPVPMSLERFEQVIEHYKQQLERDILEHEAARKRLERERAFNNYTRQLLAERFPNEQRQSGEGVTLESSPHAEYFNHFDQDGSGVLEANEKESLPGIIQQRLSSKHRLAWDLNEITIREFHDFWESEKEEWERHREETEEMNRFNRYRAAYVRDDEKPAPQTEKPATVKEAVEEEADTLEEAPAEAKADKDGLESFQVEIVLLKRTSEKLPERTLAAEVKGVLEGSGPELSARLLPWLADPSSEAVELVDYLQAHSFDGESIRLQRGGREPYVSSVSSMGSRGGGVAYTMESVGTLVQIDAVEIEESEKLALAVQFEKSYLQHADTKEEEANETADAVEEVSEAAADPDVPRTRSGRAAVSSSRTANQRPAPPTIATITADGRLILPAGQAGVLTELAKRSGSSYEEIVVLVQWN